MFSVARKHVNFDNNSKTKFLVLREFIEQNLQPGALYKYVEWIDTGPITSTITNAGAIIDTGIKIGNDHIIDCEIMPMYGTGNSVTYGNWFGSADSHINADQNMVMICLGGNTANTIMVGFNSDGAASPFNIDSSIFHQLTIDYNAVYMDNAYKGKSWDSTRRGISSLTLTLGGRNTPDGYWRCSRAKYKRFTIKLNLTVILNLRACKRLTDQKFGMLDTLTNTFYTSINNYDILGPTE